MAPPAWRMPTRHGAICSLRTSAARRNWRAAAARAVVDPVTTTYMSGGNWLLHAASVCVDQGVAVLTPPCAAHWREQLRPVRRRQFVQHRRVHRLRSDANRGDRAAHLDRRPSARQWIPIAGSTTPAPSGTLFVPIPGSSPSLIPGLQSYAIDDYGLATDFETGRSFGRGGGHAAGDANWVLMCDLTALVPSGRAEGRVGRSATDEKLGVLAGWQTDRSSQLLRLSRRQDWRSEVPAESSTVRFLQRIRTAAHGCILASGRTNGI